MILTSGNIIYKVYVDIRGVLRGGGVK